MLEWIAKDRADYIKIASEHAFRVEELRSSRDQWRQKLISSPMGDSEDLMHQLESAFSQMYVDVASRS